MNGSDVRPVDPFEEMIANLPEPVELRRIKHWVCPTSGVEIQELTKTSLSVPTFRSSVTLHTPAGTMPVVFDVPGASIGEARNNWKVAAQAAMRAFHERMESQRRRVVLASANDVPRLVS